MDFGPYTQQEVLASVEALHDKGPPCQTMMRHLPRP